MRAWLADRQNLFFLILILIHLLPIWTFRYFPSQDGPAHLENATILLEYDDPDRAIFRQYYVLNNRPDPNWFGHLILAGLIAVVPALIAEKILLTIYVVLLPLSVRYAVRAVRPDGGFLAFLVFPFIFNFPLHMGFYYFSLSLPVFFFTVGFWLKHREGFTIGAALQLALLWALLYFTHPVSLVMAGVAIAVTGIALMAADIAAGIRALGRALWSRLGIPVVASLPTLFLFVAFLGAKEAKVSAPLPAKQVGHDLLTLYSLVSYEPREQWLSTALAVLFIVVVGYALAAKIARRRATREDGLLVVVAAYVVICFTAPNKLSGGAYIAPRLILYPFLVSILWLAANPFPEFLRRSVPVLAAAIAVGLLGMHATKYAELNGYLEEYLSGMDQIRPNSTLMPLCFSRHGETPDGRALSIRVSPVFHAAGHIAAERRVVEYTNYEANTAYFPITFRPEVNPYVHVGMLEAEPPVVYPKRIAGLADYVLVWDLGEELRDHSSVRSILRLLEEDYDLIHTSSGRGLMQLYRVRPGT